VISSRVVLRTGRRLAAPAAAATALAGLALPAAAGAAADPLVWFPADQQQLLARTPAGTMPDGVATDPDISRDSRDNRHVTFTSTATNLAGPVAPGRRNVYVTDRTGAILPNANPWQVGRTRILSVGRGGKPADGDSWGASVSGFTGQRDKPERANLVGFLSTATNLTRKRIGDGRTPRAYVVPVRGGAARLVDAPGWATGIDVSGDSRRVFVATTRGLYVREKGRVRRLVRGSGIVHPATTSRGAQVAYERDGNVYVLTTATRRSTLIGPGTEPDVDAGETAGARRGHVRALTFSRDGGAFRVSFKSSGTKIEQFGVTQTATRTNSGASTIAFGEGRQVRLQIRVFADDLYGGYVRPQGVCPPQQGEVTSVAVSTRYNYTVFSCAKGGLYLFYVGPYE